MILNWWHRRQRAEVRTVDERFTDFADRVSEAMGRWRTSAFCLVLIAIWGAFGPYTGYSDSWQLWVNTPTTIVELFLGLFTLAAANRVEKRNWQLHQHMARTLSRVDAVTAEENDEIKTGDQKLAAMQAQLDRIEKQLPTAENLMRAISMKRRTTGDGSFRRRTSVSEEDRPARQVRDDGAGP